MISSPKLRTPRSKSFSRRALQEPAGDHAVRRPRPVAVTRLPCRSRRSCRRRRCVRSPGFRGCRRPDRAPSRPEPTRRSGPPRRRTGRFARTRPSAGTRSPAPARRRRRGRVADRNIPGSTIADHRGLQRQAARSAATALRRSASWTKPRAADRTTITRMILASTSSPTATLTTLAARAAGRAGSRTGETRISGGSAGRALDRVRSSTRSRSPATADVSPGRACSHELLLSAGI